MGTRAGVGVRLFTEGGKEVDRTFERLGERGDRAFSQLARGAQKVNPELTALSRTVGAVNAEMVGMTSSLGPVGQGLIALGPKAIVAGAAIAAVGTAAVKGFGLAVDASADFQGAMNDLGSKGGIRGAALDDLGEKIRALASKWGELPVTVAVAAKTLVAAGISIDDVMGGALDSVIMLAQGTEADLPSSAKVAADAMLIWGKSGSEMSDVAREISAVLNATKYELVDYAQAQGMGAAAARLAGMDFTDFNASLAATAANFSGGSDQATSLKTAMLMLGNATPQATKVMEDYGIAAFDAAGNMKPVLLFAAELQEAIKDLSEQEKLQVLGKIFGSDALKIAAALAANVDGLKKFREEILPTTDLAGQAAQRFEGWRGAASNLQTALKNLEIEAGDAGLRQWDTSFKTYMTGSINGWTKIIRMARTAWEDLTGVTKQRRMAGAGAASAAATDAENPNARAGVGVDDLLARIPGGRLGKSTPPPGPPPTAGDAATGALKQQMDTIRETAAQREKLQNLMWEYPEASQAELEARLNLIASIEQIDAARKKGLLTSAAEAARLKELAQANFDAGQAVRDHETAMTAAEQAEQRQIDLARDQEEATRAQEEAVRRAQEAFEEWSYLFEDIARGGETAERAILDLARKAIPELIKRFIDLKNAQKGPLSGDYGAGASGPGDLISSLISSLIGGGLRGTGQIGAPIDIDFRTPPIIAQSALPHFANGTNWFSGGPAVVGDGGEPEVVNLPHGSSVTPFSKLPASIVNVTVINQTDARVETREDANGDMQVIIRKEVGRQLSTGEHDRPLAGRYGLRPKVG